MRKLSDFPLYPSANSSDLLLIWDNENAVTKAIKKSDLLAGISDSGNGSGVKPWFFIDANTNLINGDKGIVDTSARNITLSLPSASFGTEIEILRLHSTNKLLLDGLTRLRGQSIPLNATTEIKNINSSSIRLIYINEIFGWLDLPSGSIQTQVPLSLPQAGLIQQFYAKNITNLANNSLVSRWDDTKSSKNATQLNISNQPSYIEAVFNNLPALQFNGNQFFDTDFTYINGNYYTVCLVEKRTSTIGNNYACGHRGSGTNTSLHFGYRGNTEFTLAQWDNDLNYTGVPGFTNQITRIWIGCLSSRGHEIWLNNFLVASNSNTTYLNANTTGVIGRAYGGGFYGYLGLLAIYTGNKSQEDVRDIFTAINNTFNVY